MAKNKTKRVMITLNNANEARFNELLKLYGLNMSDCINELIIQDYYRKVKA